MNVARLFIVASVGVLIAYYLGSVLTTLLITGSTVGDILVLNLVPLSLATVAVIIILTVGFRRGWLD